MCGPAEAQQQDRCSGECCGGRPHCGGLRGRHAPPALPHALPPAAGSSGAAPVHVDRTGGPVQPLGLPPLSPGTGDATSQVPGRALLRPLCMCSGHAALLLADRLLASHPPPGGFAVCLGASRHPGAC